jgi:hypothetical protein
MDTLRRMLGLAHVAGVPLEEMAAFAAPAFALGLSALAAGLRGVIAGRLLARRKDER